MSPTPTDRRSGDDALDIDLLTSDRVALARVAGRLDGDSAPRLVATIQGLLRAGSRDVVLDCASLDRCDAAGLRALQAIRRAQPDGATLSLVRAGPQLRRLLLDAGLDALVTVT